MPGTQKPGNQDKYKYGGADLDVRGTWLDENEKENDGGESTVGIQGRVIQGYYKAENARRGQMTTMCVAKTDRWAMTRLWWSSATSLLSQATGWATPAGGAPLSPAADSASSASGLSTHDDSTVCCGSATIEVKFCGAVPTVSLLRVGKREGLFDCVMAYSTHLHSPLVLLCVVLVQLGGFDIGRTEVSGMV